MCDTINLAALLQRTIKYCICHGRPINIVAFSSRKETKHPLRFCIQALTIVSIQITDAARQAERISCLFTCLVHQSDAASGVHSKQIYIEIYRVDIDSTVESKSLKKNNKYSIISTHSSLYLCLVSLRFFSEQALHKKLI